MSKLRAFINRVFHFEQMDGDGLCPVYLRRWTLLTWGEFLSVYVHQFVGDDWSLDMHDHPKRFWSIGLKGRYVEHSPRVLTMIANGEWAPADRGCSCPACFPLEHSREWRAPWIRTFPATHIHRITGPTPENPCWTLVIVGRAVRPWGFWSGGHWSPWRQYVDSAAAIERRSCP